MNRSKEEDVFSRISIQQEVGIWPPYLLALATGSAEMDLSPTDPESLVQLKRVSVVLVDCCRTQEQRGRNRENNTDAEQSKSPMDLSPTDPESLVQLKKVSVVLVDCCRTQEQRGRNRENNTDAEQSKSQVTASQVFTCSLCPCSYTAQLYLHKHIKRSHTDEYVLQLRSGEIRPETLAPSSFTLGENC
ncbi:hypothetical protein AALO_G00090060 [Alosa alosa]|uniref:C2H2-type domain-containing protein n=1 Tax=Alosa alosa TaxID=278164 RepID=A0AAV6GVC1_9TELE|nr:hypothetical protein AALO_G00090060 [Alosa alosa]